MRRGWRRPTVPSEKVWTGSRKPSLGTRAPAIVSRRATELTATPVAGRPPTETETPPRKFVPVSVMGVPPPSGPPPGEGGPEIVGPAL
jgi:hypothetical protein